MAGLGGHVESPVGGLGGGGGGVAAPYDRAAAVVILYDSRDDGGFALNESAQQQFHPVHHPRRPWLGCCRFVGVC